MATIFWAVDVLTEVIIIYLTHGFGKPKIQILKQIEDSKLGKSYEVVF